MPLPPDAKTLTGGCSCGAIRYRVEVPEAEKRTSSPLTPPEAGYTLPTAMLCHCNDCRRHTGSALPIVFFQAPSHAITVSILDATEDQTSNVTTGRFLDVLNPDYDQAATDASRPPYKPSCEVLCASRASTILPTYLRFFHSVDSGDGMSRCFCSNCGSPVAFHIKIQPDWCHDGNLPEDFHDIFDLFAGTLDRWVLEEGWAQPEDEVNWKNGVRMGQRVSATAGGLRELAKYQGLGPHEGTASEQELEKLRNE